MSVRICTRIPWRLSVISRPRNWSESSARISGHPVPGGSSAVTLGGEIELSVGLGFGALIVTRAEVNSHQDGWRGEAPEVPPPGAGLNTVTKAVPAVAMSPAEIVAVSCVLLT